MIEVIPFYILCAAVGMNIWRIYRLGCMTGDAVRELQERITRLERNKTTPNA